MLSICDILIFKTPFEKNEVFFEKFRKIENMLDTYLKNSGILLKKKETKNEDYSIKMYSRKDFPIEILFVVDNDFELQNYMPVGILSYKVNESFFEKENITNFLNDNIKFIYNVFFDDFFVDYDYDKYKLLDFNKGKKVDYNKLNNFDLENPNNPYNKAILDSLMYIYFNLIKNINSVENNSEYIEKIMQKRDFQKYFTGNIDLFGERLEGVRKNLFDNALQIKNQIDIFVNLIK